MLMIRTVKLMLALVERSTVHQESLTIFEQQNYSLFLKKQGKLFFFMGARVVLSWDPP